LEPSITQLLTCLVLAVAMLTVNVNSLPIHASVNERGQVPLSDPLSEVLRPKFGLRPDLSQNLTWRWRFGLRIFLDQIWVLARC